MTGKSVLLVNSSFLPNVGGVENSLARLAEEYLQSGYAVTIVSNDLEHSGRRLPKVDNFGKASIRRYQHRRSLAQFIPAFKLLKELKRSNNFDAVICRSWQLISVLRAVGFRKITYIAPALNSLYSAVGVSRQTSFKRRLSYWVKTQQEIMALRLASRVIVFSKQMKQQLQRYVSGSEIIIQPPGVDKNRFCSVEQQEKQQLKQSLGLPDKQVLLCLGRLERVKGFNLAIEAMQFLSDDYVLVFVGNGSQKVKLEALSDSLGMNYKVVFKDATHQPESYFKTADAFLFTSLYESFGQVLLEAVACGLKIVGFAPSRTPEVNTAIEDIFFEYPSLVEYAADYKAESLALAVEQAVAKQGAKVTRETAEEVEGVEERAAFLATHSWSKLAEIATQ